MDGKLVFGSTYFRRIFALYFIHEASAIKSKLHSNSPSGVNDSCVSHGICSMLIITSIGSIPLPGFENLRPCLSQIVALKYTCLNELTLNLRLVTILTQEYNLGHSHKDIRWVVICQVIDGLFVCFRPSKRTHRPKPTTEPCI